MTNTEERIKKIVTSEEVILAISGPPGRIFAEFYALVGAIILIREIFGCDKVVQDSEGGEVKGGSDEKVD